MKVIITIFLIFTIYLQCFNFQCVTPSITTVLGTHAPTGEICSGQLIFEDEFDEFDLSKWYHEITIGGGGNGEFQWYDVDPENTFVQDGKLVIRPTLTVDKVGEDNLTSAYFVLEGCNVQFDGRGCEHQATPEYPMNPIKSGKVTTVESFAFKYGKIEIRAKLPTGDWFWPALWLLPNQWEYGGWPMSGEIDLIESRGNRNYYNAEWENIGIGEIGTALHFGNSNFNGYASTVRSKHSPIGKNWGQDFHTFQLEWTPGHITWHVDNEFINTVYPNKGGFYELGHITGENPWSDEIDKMAPFNKEFHLLFNLAVGGTNYYFPETNNIAGKPWRNNSPTPIADFWNGRQQWLPTWNLNVNNSYEASFIIDSVRVWAL